MRVSRSRAMLLVAVGAIAQLSSATAATTEHGYVTDSMRFPTTNTQADRFGRNMNGRTGPENRLGRFYATLAGYGLDLNENQNQAISAGEIVMLHSLRTPSLANTRNATWQVLYGHPTSDPDFSGSGSFDVQTSGPRSARLDAQIKDHRVSTVSGAIPVGLNSEGPFTVKMTKARVFATCTHASCWNGRINGAVSKFQVDNKLIPAMAHLFTVWIMRDCPTGEGSCAADSEGMTVQALFDADDDSEVTSAEVRTNSLVDQFFRPDLDLVNNDGVKDAVSFGFGFHAVHANLVR